MVDDVHRHLAHCMRAFPNTLPTVQNACRALAEGGHMRMVCPGGWVAPGCSNARMAPGFAGGGIVE